MGVGTWYYLQPAAAPPAPPAPTPSPTPSTGDGSGSGSGYVPTIDDCTAKFEIKTSTQCQNDTEAGVSWFWDTSAADGIGKACMDKTVGYNIIASSSSLPAVKLAAYVDGGTATTTGITGVPQDSFIKDSQLTFSVMPIDINNKNVISAPTDITIDRGTADSDCSKQGIQSQIQNAVPFWNSNNYYWPVSVKNKTGSSADLHVRVYDANGTKMNDDTYPVPKSKDYLIPQGGTLSISCDILNGHGVTWTYDQLKSGNISSLTYHCSVSGFHTNINQD